MSSDLDRRAQFERVAADVYEPLQRYLRRRASAGDAADVLADTLLVVWRRIDDVPDDPLPWSYGVARRCLANHRRGNTRRLRLVQRAGTRSDRDGDTRLDPQLAVDDSDPELVSAMEALTESEAEIVRLWAWEQLEPRHIAEVLDITPNAVSVALTRAKRKLAERLNRHDSLQAGQVGANGRIEQEGGGR